MQTATTQEPPAAPTQPATAPVRPKQKGSAQLFQNPVLERLSHTHIALPVGIFAITTILSLYYGLTHGFMSGASALGLFLLGLFGFTFLEYAVHRYLYHIPATTPGRVKFQYTMHGVHHEYPKDKTRLAMPPIVTVFVSSLLFFIFRLSFGSYAFGLLAGFVSVRALRHSRVLATQKLSESVVDPPQPAPLPAGRSSLWRIEHALGPHHWHHAQQEDAIDRLNFQHKKGGPIAGPPFLLSDVAKACAARNAGPASC